MLLNLIEDFEGYITRLYPNHETNSWNTSCQAHQLAQISATLVSANYLLSSLISLLKTLRLIGVAGRESLGNGSASSQHWPLLEDQASGIDLGLGLHYPKNVEYAQSLMACEQHFLELATSQNLKMNSLWDKEQSTQFLKLLSRKLSVRASLLDDT